MKNEHMKPTEGPDAFSLDEYSSDYDFATALSDLEALVRDMRCAQKEYFKTRSKESLIGSKKLEAEIDKMLGIK